MAKFNYQKNDVPPPPPGGPAILASDVDDEAEMIAAQIMGGSSTSSSDGNFSSEIFSPNPINANSDVDTEADAIATQLMGVPDMSMPPPKAATIRAQTKKTPVPPLQRPKVVRKTPTTLQTPPPPRTVPDRWGGIAALTHADRKPNIVAEAMDDVVGIPKQIIRALPYGNEIIDQHIKPFIQQNAQANREITQNPIAGNAATLMNIPRGFLGVFEDLGNAAVNTAARAVPFSTLQAMGINALPDAPFKTREHWDQLTGQSSAKLRQQLPATAATGEMAGASMIPMTPHAAKGAPVSIRQGIKHGAIGGQALGMVGSAGAQAKEGSVNYEKAALEGLPTAFMGGALGAGGAAISKGFGGLGKGFGKPNAGKAHTDVAGKVLERSEARTHTKPADVMITTGDGARLTPVEVVARIKDPGTPAAHKRELNELLDAHEKELVGNPSQQPEPASEWSKPNWRDDLTVLPPDQEVRFQQWVEDNKVPFDPSPNADYDMRGYWKDIASRGQSSTEVNAFDNEVHYPDTYKTPFHKSFSRESKFATSAAPEWVGNDSDGWKLMDKSGKVIVDESKSSTPAESSIEQTFPNSRPESAAEVTPAAESPVIEKPKRFFGDTRTYRQGMSGVDAQVTFPSPLEADLATYAAKGYKNTLGEQRLNKMAEDLGIPREELYQYATEYNNSVKQQAREQAQAVISAGKAVEDVFLNAPKATRNETPPAATVAAPVQNNSPFSAEHVPNEPYPENIPSWNGEMPGAKRDLDFKGAMTLPRGHGARQIWIDQYEPSLTKTGKLPKIEQGTQLGRLAQKYLDMGGKLDRETLVWLSMKPEQQASHPDMKTQAFKEFEQNVLQKKPEPPPPPPPSDNYTPTAPDGYEAPAPKPVGDRFTVQKNTEKKGGYVDIIDSSTGEVISSSKRTEAQAAALAAKYNDLAVNAPDKLEPELRRGSKNFLDFRKTTDPVRNEIVEAGQDLPEGHALSEPLKAVATAKQAFDHARAKFESAVDAFYKLTGEKQGVTMKRERRFNKEVEALVKDAQASGGKDLTVEINNGERVEPVEAPRFQRGMKPEEAFKVVEDLHADMKAKEKAYQASRKDVEQPFLESDLGQSVNIRTEDGGKVNIRAVPKQGTELNAKAEEIRGPVPSQEKTDRSWAKVQRVANQKGVKTRRNQRGSLRVVIGKKNAPPAEKLDATESMFSSLIQSAEELASRAKTRASDLRRALTLKNTGDIMSDISDRFETDLKTEWDQFFGRLLKASHGIKFDTEDAGLLEAARLLEPWTLREGGQAEVTTADGITKRVDLSRFSPEQLWYLSQEKAAYSRLADAIQETLNVIDENVPHEKRDFDLQKDINVLTQTRDHLRGIRPRDGSGEAEFVRWLSGSFMDYLFKWYPRFHLLNMTDLPITGGLRLGLHRISSAVELFGSDKSVRDFLLGVQSKSAVDEARQDWARETLDVDGKKSNSLLAKIRRTADFPSDQMNFLATFGAGAIERGEQIGYKGFSGLEAGRQYLKDFARGTLPKEEQIMAYSHSLQAAHDVTGLGMRGLNRDVIQRSGSLGRAVTVFTSQPIRMARLVVNKTIKAIRSGEITPLEGAARLASFVGAQVFFGGEAIIPKEVDTLEEAFPQIKPYVQAVRDVANALQGARYIPLVDRDLTEKLRVHLLPALGNIRGNIALEKIGRLFEQGKKLDPRALSSGIFLTLSWAFRGGGTALEQAAKNFSAAAKGDKTFYAFEGVGSHPKKTTFKKLEKRNYNMGDALADTFLPGERPSVGAWKKQQREAAIEKSGRKRGISFKKK